MSENSDLLLNEPKTNTPVALGILPAVGPRSATTRIFLTVAGSLKPIPAREILSTHDRQLGLGARYVAR